MDRLRVFRLGDSGWVISLRGVVDKDVAQEAAAEISRRSGQVIVANEPFGARSLGIAVARAADAALLCIEMGRTRIASAQRTNN